MIYQWKAGFHAAGVPPHAAAQQIESIRQTYQMITSELIVEDSRRETAPLHAYFEWDDSTAARHYRIGQASSVLAALVVVAEDHELPVPAHRAYVRVASVDETDAEIENSELPRIKQASRFERIDIALSDDALRVRVLESAWRELESWRQRYADYQDLARMCAVIDEERRRVGRLAA